MFGRKWRNSALIEGEKDAILISRMEHLPSVNTEFDGYPVDLTLSKKVTFFQAIKKSIELSKANIYNMFYKDK